MTFDYLFIAVSYLTASVINGHKITSLKQSKNAIKALASVNSQECESERGAVCHIAMCSLGAIVPKPRTGYSHCFKKLVCEFRPAFGLLFFLPL